MDYGQLIRDAWAMTWRNRWLWVLGLFAGGGAFGAQGGNGNVQWRANRPDIAGLPPEMASAFESLGAWFVANMGLIITLAVMAAILGLVVAVISLISQGGMAQATAALATGEPATLGQAWRAGVRLFWRYVGLYLVLVLLAILVAGVIGGLVAFVVGVADTLGPLAVALGVLIGVPLALVGIAVGVAVSVIVAYAQRAIAVENVGPVDALRSGWQLLRANLGTSVLLWLLQLAMQIAVGIGIAIVVVAAAAVLGGAGFVVWLAAGWSAATISYAVIAGLALLAVILVIGAITNTFFWGYWTLAYLRLSGRQTPAAVA